MRMVEPNRVSDITHLSQLYGFPAQWVLRFGEEILYKSPLFSDHPYGDEPVLGLGILERWITAKSGSGTLN